MILGEKKGRYFNYLCELGSSQGVSRQKSAVKLKGEIKGDFSFHLIQFSSSPVQPFFSLAKDCLFSLNSLINPEE